MSSDVSQLISQLLRLEHGQNPQILSLSGPSNQTSHSNQGALSSDGPNASQRFQVANSNVTQVNYNFHFVGNSNLGARAIANGDHGAHPNHQDSQSTSCAGQSKIEAPDQANLNAKLAAVKESTVKVRRSTEEVKGSIIRLIKTTAKLSEWITTLNWPTFKLSLVSEQDVTMGGLAIEQCMLLIKLSQSILEFGRSSVEHGKSTVRDSDSISMTTVSKPISLVVFDALTSKLGETAATFKESRGRFKELFMGYIESLTHFDTPQFNKSTRTLDNSKDSRLEELMTAADLNTFEEIMSEVRESIETIGMSLAAFSESMVAYAESLAAPDDVIAAFRRENK